MEPTAATILLVEDDRATRTFLADNLSADGYDLLEADRADDAQRLMETRYPDLAIVDLGLPDRDGLELIRQIREADRIAGRLDPDLPLLVLSGRVGELDRLRGFERGCDDYVAKPAFWVLSTGSGRLTISIPPRGGAHVSSAFSIHALISWLKRNTSSLGRRISVDAIDLPGCGKISIASKTSRINRRTAFNVGAFVMSPRTSALSSRPTAGAYPPRALGRALRASLVLPREPPRPPPSERSNRL